MCNRCQYMFFSFLNSGCEGNDLAYYCVGTWDSHSQVNTNLRKLDIVTGKLDKINEIGRVEGKQPRTVVKAKALADLSRLENQGKAIQSNKGWREEKIGLERGVFGK